MLPERARYYLLIDLESAPDVLARLLADVTDAAVYDRRPDPERFTLREMVAHLADWENVFLRRLTQTREKEKPTLQGLDEGQVALDHDYAHSDPQESLARYREGRRKIVAFLRDLSPEQWPRIGVHTEVGPITIEEQAVLIAAHDGNHRQQTVSYVSGEGTRGETKQADHSLILRQALQEQYHAALAMLAECVRKCPDDLWTDGPHPRPFWRAFWRIAFHAAYFTHLYLGQNEAAYQSWPDRPAGCPELWQRPFSVEPYELPEDFDPFTKKQILDYIAYTDSLVDPTVATLDLDAGETGIPWYKNMNKLSHQFLNLRHVQGHVGQLSELLMAREIDTDWISKTGRPPSEIATD